MAAIGTAPAPGGDDTFGFALGAMTIAFVVFITARGELPTYLSFFLWTPSKAAPPSQIGNLVSQNAPLAPALATWQAISGLNNASNAVSSGINSMLSQGASSITSLFGF